MNTNSKQLGDRKAVMALRHANQLNTRRYFYAHCHKGLVSTAGQVCPDQIVPPAHLDSHLLQLLEIYHQARPGDVHRPLIQSPLQIHLQPESQKTGHNVPHTLLISEKLYKLFAGCCQVFVGHRIAS